MRGLASFKIFLKWSYLCLYPHFLKLKYKSWFRNIFHCCSVPVGESLMSYLHFGVLDIKLIDESLKLSSINWLSNTLSAFNPANKPFSYIILVNIYTLYTLSNTFILSRKSSTLQDKNIQRYSLTKSIHFLHTENV